LIYPHLIYGITIYGSSDSHAHYLQPLHRIHKKIIRIITKSPPLAHTSPLFQQHEILNIFQLFTLRTSILAHQSIHPQQKQLTISQPQHNNHFTFVQNQHHYPTRKSKTNALHQSHKTPHSTNTIIQQWNSLPTSITNIPKLEPFKHALKTFLLAQPQPQPPIPTLVLDEATEITELNACD
jgi:hypothetical protein